MKTTQAIKHGGAAPRQTGRSSRPRVQQAPSGRTSSGEDDRSKLDPKLVAVIEKVVQVVLQEHANASPDARRRRERPEDRRLYDVPSAADQISVSRAKAWELIKDGRLRAVKIDARTVISNEELDRFRTEEVRPA